MNSMSMYKLCIAGISWKIYFMSRQQDSGENLEWIKMKTLDRSGALLLLFGQKNRMMNTPVFSDRITIRSHTVTDLPTQWTCTWERCCIMWYTGNLWYGMMNGNGTSLKRKMLCVWINHVRGIDLTAWKQVGVGKEIWEGGWWSRLGSIAGKQNFTHSN